MFRKIDDTTIFDSRLVPSSRFPLAGARIGRSAPPQRTERSEVQAVFDEKASRRRLMMTMTTSHVAYSCNILAPAVGEDASIFQQISSRWQRSQGEAAREGAEDKPWGTGKKTQAVRGDVAAGSMPMKQPESKHKKDDKTRDTQ